MFKISCGKMSIIVTERGWPTFHGYRFETICVRMFETIITKLAGLFLQLPLRLPKAV